MVALRVPAGQQRPLRLGSKDARKRQAQVQSSTGAAKVSKEEQLLEDRRASSHSTSTSQPAVQLPACAEEVQAVEICRSITLPAETSCEEAVEALRRALGAHLPKLRIHTSGVIRLEVPLPPTSTAMQWLKAQQSSQAPKQPSIYFSPRRSSAPKTPGTAAAAAAACGAGPVAGWGCAWRWQGEAGGPLDDSSMRSIQAFLSPEAPRVRALGGSRFDSTRLPAEEWREFGSYYFMLPQLEYAELAACHTLACTLAWHGNAASGIGPVNVQAAAADALQALQSVSAPAAPAAPAIKIRRHGMRHSPDRQLWGAIMEDTHRLLKEAGQAHEMPLGDVDPQAARQEYESHGQGGLDALLAALDDRAEVYSSYDDSELTKVVLARRSDIAYTGRLQPLELLQTLQERDSRAFQLLLQLPSGATFMASTPELLFERSGRKVASEAVAGTRRRGPAGDVEKDFWLAFDLLRNPKDHIEFTLVRDWIRDALSGVCSEVCVDTEKSVLKQGSVQHLYGRLSGQLHDDCTDAHLLAALHPTPAVCGRPRQAARGMLSSLEPFDRGFYAGPFGWVSGGASEFAVAIRSALIHPPKEEQRVTTGEAAQADARLMSLFAGVGIVSGSKAESEWQELELKIRQFETLLREPEPLRQRPNVNQLWAGLIVEELCRLGINTFCIAPGSRSSPLTVAAARHTTARVVSCIDERSLAFWALGYGRASRRPAVVITSSGTAVANLLPAVVEAAHSRVPMLLLTADRPGELRDTAANQTIDQVKMFGGYTRWAFDLLPPSASVPARTALTTVDTAVRFATHPAPGPVHINCQFREPLGTKQEAWPLSALKGLGPWEAAHQAYTRPVLTPPRQQSAVANSQLQCLLGNLSGKKGLIVVGELLRPEDALACLQIAQALDWPVAADVLSGLSVGANQHKGVTVLRHLDLVLLDREGVWPQICPQAILQIGGRLTSKRTNQFLEWAALEHGAEWMFLDPSPERHDAAHCVSLRLQFSAAELASLLASKRALEALALPLQT